MATKTRLKEWNEIKKKWRKKQKAASPAFYYGDGGTIHDTRYLDVETYQGKVVAVWFRCKILPFKQSEIEEGRATIMERFGARSKITGVEIVDD